MATQTVTVQLDQSMADVVRALMTKIEASGKSTADFFAQMEADEQALVVEMENGKTMVLQDGSSYQKAMSDVEGSEVRKAVRRALDSNDYQRLVESVVAPSEAELAESRAAVKRGLADVAAGRTRPIEEFFEELEKRHPFLARVAETL